MRLDRIKLIIEMARQDINVGTLAKKADISRGTLSGIRCGRSCNERTCAAIARALGVDVLDIIEQEEK